MEQTLATFVKPGFHYVYERPEHLWWVRRTETSTTTEHVLMQERDVSYRFNLHQHPYVQELMGRLLRKGVKGLQAADTEFAPERASLPDSLAVQVPVGRALRMEAERRIVFLTNVRATLQDGTVTDLVAGTSLRTTAPVDCSAQTSVKAILAAGMTGTPVDGAQLAITADQPAALTGDATVRTAATVTVRLFDAQIATIPAGTDVIVPARTMMVLTAGADVQLLSSKERPVLFQQLFSTTAYNPSEMVERPHPVRDLDFLSTGAYAIYNWELFFHVPLTMAMHLSKNQRFAEAQQWFHYLFDPTDDSDGPTPERFWKVRPFRYTDVVRVEEILTNLSTGADQALLEQTVESIRAWEDDPFRPHTVAGFRQQAYMYKTVMAYLDNLIAWGDSLFRQDTGESIDEAMMLYVLAANILGPRPQTVPKKVSARPRTYANLRNELQELGSVLVKVESELGCDAMPMPSTQNGDNAGLITVQSLGRGLYFGVPRNEKLLTYWDTVADRLFKIRNSLNIQGIFRQLALFEPPIDPAMLARAAAAGLDVSAVINGLNQPLPLVRSQLLMQKASELCQEVKAMGNALLSAMEKEDGEAMQVLRTKHERAMNDLVEHVRYAQVQEATKTKEGLVRSLATAVERFVYFERQLGRKADEIAKGVPDIGDIDKAAMERMKASLKEKEMERREIGVDIAEGLLAQVAGVAAGGKLLSSHEVNETILMEGAQVAIDVSSGLNVLAGAIHAVLPDIETAAKFWGIGAGITISSKMFAGLSQAAATASHGIADRMNFEARRNARIDGFDRREREWAYQSNLAAADIDQMHKQLRAAQIREAIAELELRNHRQQIKHAEEIERFLNEEGTNKQGKQSHRALYAWMKREVKGLYAQCFQFAFDLSKKAERAMQHELGDKSATFIQYGYLAGNHGLLAGEKLHLDVKRMEMAYHDLNQREYELTKHISLRQLDPGQLLELRTKGSCTIKLPESLFDLDGPGHYFRRVRSMAVSIPCITGPYANVNCTLTLTRSSVRTSPLIGDTYDRQGAEDERFSDHFGSTRSIVTSSAQNDSGLFEVNLRDERYLPFEYAGAISEWRLEMPATRAGDPRQFDYATISDVILHMRYTARQAGQPMKDAAMDNVKQQMTATGAFGTAQLFSLRHDMPDEWARLKRIPNGGAGTINISLKEEHFPFWTGVLLATAHRQKARLWQRTGTGPITKMAEVDLANADLLGPLNIDIPSTAMSDLWITVDWRTE